MDLLQGETYAYPPELRQEILDLYGETFTSPAEMARLDDVIATANYVNLRLWLVLLPDRI